MGHRAPPVTGWGPIGPWWARRSQLRSDLYPSTARRGGTRRRGDSREEKEDVSPVPSTLVSFKPPVFAGVPPRHHQKSGRLDRENVERFSILYKQAGNFHGLGPQNIKRPIGRRRKIRPLPTPPLPFPTIA